MLLVLVSCVEFVQSDFLCIGLFDLPIIKNNRKKKKTIHIIITSNIEDYVNFPNGLHNLMGRI